jgi:hypothetical protein
MHTLRYHLHRPTQLPLSLSPMSSTVIPPSNFEFIFDAALANYREHTGVDLSQYPFAEKLQSCQTPDDILELFQEKVKEFKDFRNGNHKLTNCLGPVVQVLHAFSGALGDVARLPSHLPTSDHFLTLLPVSRCHSNQQTSYFMVSIFFSAYVSSLLFSITSLSESYLPFQTAISVGTSYDALTELFECVANFFGRLRIYSEIPFDPTMSGLTIRILVEVLSVLALATKQIRLGRFSTPLIG